MPQGNTTAPFEDVRLLQGLIIEGVTGAGKTQTMKAFHRASSLDPDWRQYDVFREKETFGEFLPELINNPESDNEYKLRRLTNVLSTVASRSQRQSNYRFLLERAHFSYYALLPDWNLYENADAQLARVNTLVVVLQVPEDRLRERSLYRADRDPIAWPRFFTDYYKSEESAVQNIALSQKRRYEGVEKSALPHLVIDTSAMAWDTYAEQIVDKLWALQHQRADSFLGGQSKSHTCGQLKTAHQSVGTSKSLT